MKQKDAHMAFGDSGISVMKKNAFQFLDEETNHQELFQKTTSAPLWTSETRDFVFGKYAQTHTKFGANFQTWSGPTAVKNNLQINYSKSTNQTTYF